MVFVNRRHWHDASWNSEFEYVLLWTYWLYYTFKSDASSFKLVLFLNKVFPLIHTKFCLCLPSVEICFMALTCLYLKPAK